MNLSIMLKLSIITLSGLLIFGCSSLGETMIAGDGVRIRVSQDITDNKKKITQLQKVQGVETFHRYVTHRFRKLKVRKSLRIEILITKYRGRGSFSPGRDSLGIDVTVSEHEKILKTFSQYVTTKRKRNRAMEKMSKQLAARIYEDIKDL